MAKDPQHILLHNHLANSYTLLANCLLDSGDTKSAIEYYRKAVAARLTLSEKSPNSSANRGALAECYANLAKALESSDREAALKQYSNSVELLEPLTAADRSNVQYRIVLADALSNTARLYSRMAEQNGEPSMRLQSWTNARSFYQRSQAVWLELDTAGKLPAERVRAIREVSGEIARCDDSMAKLQQAR